MAFRHRDSIESIHYLTEAETTALRLELELLAIIHHRNKNQHHGAVWYTHLRYLKSALTRLLPLCPPQVPRIEGKRLHGAKTSPESDTYTKEITALSNRIHAAYLSFSQIIGTGQYVALGLVLLGVVSRVWAITRGLQSKLVRDDASSKDEELADITYFEDSGREMSDDGVVLSREPVTEDGKVIQPIVAKEDKKVVRNHSNQIAGLTSATKSDEKAVLGSDPVMRPKKRKKKKIIGKDEIDSIFG